MKPLHNQIIKLFLISLVGFGSEGTAQSFEKLPYPINTENYSEYAPVISPDNRLLVYESRRGKTWKLYQTERPSKDSTWSKPRYLTEINDGYGKDKFIGGPFITYDNNYLYFTSNRHGSRGGIDIWYCERLSDNKWGSPKNLGAPVNTSAYEGFPSLTPDGKTLYFMRYIHGKVYRGSDCFKIMVSKKDKNGRWGIPKELPYPINYGCDMEPRIMADGRTLIFSSNRDGSKGRMDLFQSFLQDDGSWSEPVNMSFLNSKADDQAISVPASGDQLYFTIGFNDRHYDIYRMEMPAKFRPKKTIVVRGKITDKKTGKPLSAELVVTDLQTNTEFANIKSNRQDGTYTVILREGTKYDFACVRKGYSFHSEFFQLDSLEESEEFEKNIELQPLEKGVSFDLTNIEFDFNSSDLKLDTRPELKRVLQVMELNQMLRVEIGAHTDNLGTNEYNLKLSQERAEAVVDYLNEKGIERSRMEAVGYGKTRPKVQNNSKENRAQNRRVEFTVIE